MMIARIIESQAGRNVRLAASDIVISNQDVSLDSLAHDGRAVGRTIRSMIGKHGNSSVILYEYPFNERIRTYLRLEHLFLRLDELVARETPAGSPLRPDHAFSRSWMWPPAPTSNPTSSRIWKTKAGPEQLPWKPGHF
jgi:hypothetical protein